MKALFGARFSGCHFDIFQSCLLFSHTWLNIAGLFDCVCLCCFASLNQAVSRRGIRTPVHLLLLLLLVINCIRIIHRVSH